MKWYQIVLVHLCSFFYLNCRSSIEIMINIVNLPWYWCCWWQWSKILQERGQRWTNKCFSEVNWNKIAMIDSCKNFRGFKNRFVHFFRKILTKFFNKKSYETATTAVKNSSKNAKILIEKMKEEMLDQLKIKNYENVMVTRFPLEFQTMAPPTQNSFPNDPLFEHICMLSNSWNSFPLNFDKFPPKSIHFDVSKRNPLNTKYNLISLSNLCSFCRIVIKVEPFNKRLNGKKSRKSLNCYFLLFFLKEKLM